MQIDQFIITALVYTAIGWYFGFSHGKKEMVTSVVETLIERGFIKTSGNGADQRILKYDEEA